MADWVIERLDHSHDRGPFRCGKTSLDTFLHSLVNQYEKRKLGRTFVVVRSGERRVYGYYRLAYGAVPLQNLPPELPKSCLNTLSPSPCWRAWPSIKVFRAVVSASSR